MTDAIIARKDAMRQGLKRYFTGKPCKKNSHVAQRLCSNGECLACVKEDEPARSRRRLAANPDKMREQARAGWKRWAAAHPEERKASIQRWRDANSEKWRESNLRSKRANQQKYTDAQRADYAINPEKYRVLERKRRARIKGSGGTHTPAELAEIFAAQRGRCAYCRADLKRAKKHVDHIIPLARGGSNGRANLQYLCPPCNHSKNARDPVTFARSIGLLL